MKRFLAGILALGAAWLGRAEETRGALLFEDTFDWTADRLTFGLDRKPYATVPLSAFDLPDGGNAFRRPHYLLVNLALTRKWGGHDDFPSVDEFPKRYEIDFVRVYAPLCVRQVSVKVGAARPFSLLHVSDSHLAGADERDDEAVRAFARERTNLGRERGAAYLDEALDYARARRLQVVHTGDVIETASRANFSRAGEILRTNAVLACVGNHEFWRTGKTWDESDKGAVSADVRAAYPGAQPSHAFETNGVSFFVFDNAFGRVSPAVTSAFERVVAKGLPVVLVCHVPFPAEDLLVDPYIACHLTGEGAAKGDAATEAFIARVRGEPRVRAILCGHLHRFVRTRFSPTAEMCVAGALFDGEACEIAFE